MASPEYQGYKQLQLDLWSLLSGAETSLYSDVVFYAADPKTNEEEATKQAFHAHKVIIYHTAPILYTSFLSLDDGQKPTAATLEIEPHILKLCLEFLYTGAVMTSGVTKDDKAKLISFAQHYDIPYLMSQDAWRQTSDSFWILPEPHLVASESTAAHPPPKPIMQARNDPTFADVTLLVDGQRFHAHKAILAARSAYFARMFSSGLAESFQSEIAITQASASSFGLFLDYLYSATLRDWSLLTPDAAVELVPICHQYGASPLVNPQSTQPSDLHLKEICEHLLGGVLDGDNACLIYDIALFHNATQLVQRCAHFIRRNLEEVSCSNNFVYLSDAGVAAAEQAVKDAWQLAQSPAQVAGEAARRLATLAVIHSRQERIAQSHVGEEAEDAEAEAEEEESGKVGDQEDAKMSLQKAEKLWRSLFWGAMVDLVSMGSSDPATTVPVRTEALLNFLQKKGETVEVISFTRFLRRGGATLLEKTSSYDLSLTLGINASQVLKELVFFRFRSPKRAHAYKRQEYDLVLVLLNGNRQVDEHLVKQHLFGEGYQEADNRSLLALASHEAVFHRTGFSAAHVPAFYHRKPLTTIVDSSLVDSAQADPIFYANCGTMNREPLIRPLSVSEPVNETVMKIHFDTVMRLLPAEHVTIVPVSQAFPKPAPKPGQKQKGQGRAGCEVH